jgi:hypothetical protein
MFNDKYFFHYIFAISLIIILSYIGNKYKETISTKDDEYKLIQKYLLNDSPLYGMNKPKIWIHSKYETNARKWKDFHSRNTTNLNQPYIHYTIQSIINHCGNDFHICLIDDDSFQQLIPGWEIDVFNLAEPMKSNFRKIAMIEILNIYGGFIVPNSFLCMKSLNSLYKKETQFGFPFVCQSLNRTENIEQYKHRNLYIPNIEMMGSLKNNSCISELLSFMKQQNNKMDFTNENDFLGKISVFINERIKQMKINLVGGEKLGIRDKKKKPIIVDDLFEDKSLDLDESCYGILISKEEVLKRHKYSWFSYLDKDDILKSKSAIVKYLKQQVMEHNNEYNQSSVISSFTSV